VSSPRGRPSTAFLASAAITAAAAAFSVWMLSTGGRPRGAFLWPPGFRMVLSPAPEVFPGVSGDSLFFANSRGVRGDELGPRSDYRILAVGGSTTQCLYLDQSEAWPAVLQSRLSAPETGRRVWVGNAGRSGMSTAHHLVQMESLLSRHPELDALLMLVGVNDLLLGVCRSGWRERQGPTELLRAAFSVPPDGVEPFKDFRFGGGPLGRVFTRLASAPEPGTLDRRGRAIEGWRRLRREASSYEDMLPELSAELEAYARRLEALADLAERRSLRLVFLTQPVLWRADLSEADLRLLWLGGIGRWKNGVPRAYYSPGALARGMRAYNETLLDVCRRRRIECVDLASDLPKDVSVFYDDCHFNENGARKVAEAVSRHFLAGPPFK